jgi:hypothetical protein
MFPDFATEYADFIADDGKLTVPIAMPLPSRLTFLPDQDGLLMSATVPSMSGRPCLLSVLFPMTIAEAVRRQRKRQMPAQPNDIITITHRIDEVVGRGGERYGRFGATITKTHTRQKLTTTEYLT